VLHHLVLAAEAAAVAGARPARGVGHRIHPRLRRPRSDYAANSRPIHASTARLHADDADEAGLNA
jgi:hypothetical protein